MQTSNYLNAGFGAEMPGNSGGLIRGVSSSSSSSSRGGTGGDLGGAILRFKTDIDDHLRGGSTRPPSPVIGGVTILAAAARIERGDFSQPPPCKQLTFFYFLRFSPLQGDLQKNKLV